MKKVYTARDSMEAHFVVGLLAQEGIRATVLGETLGAARGELPVTLETLPSVWVNDEDSRRATAFVIRRVKVGPTEDGPSRSRRPWTCPNCGEGLEGQFSNCWDCQTPRPVEPDGDT